ncbi:MMPL family transporter [Dehalogenimonas etheniformans]|uniref:MMPL family transporter n=1 Tax=Dehalogenimonas etheniformans TaxID=1536648 RepID=A0A2P5P8C1_9CHLR|nr:MMPL family transporter [Dehalogenimonas etheniformans]PPD58547.1 MMPL family transporter [Dehalogenimonas etheniformans]QNT76689.1 MMPL family transporter [Dehalogenimonas etheniformans]
MNLVNGISSLARASARRPWVTIGMWVVGLVAAVGFMVTGNALVNEITMTDNPESRQADTLIKDRLSNPTDATTPRTEDETIIIKSDTLTIDSPEYRAAIESLYADIMALGDKVVVGGINYYMTFDSSLVSADRHTTMIPLVMVDKAENFVDQVYAVGDKLAADNSQFKVYYTGSASFNADTMALAEDTMTKGESIGIMVALVVLAIVFGALVAALLPVALGVVAIVAALGLIGLTSHFMGLSFFITNMVTMMGLAVGIDYSLFIVSRYREERKKGLSKVEAIAVTSRTANKAIFFSGMTVVLALVGLLIFPLSIFQSMGLGSIMVVVAAVLASMTILPAIISLLGDRVNKIRMPFTARAEKREAVEHKISGFWAGMVKVVTHKPLVSVVIVAGIMIAALTPYFDKQSGFSGISGLPDDLRAKEGFMVLVNDFHIGMDDPAKIVVDGDINAAATQDAINKLVARIGTDSNFSSTNVVSYADKNLAIIYANLVGDPASLNSMDAVRALRADYIPAAFGDISARAFVTGGTAGTLDFNATTDSYTPVIFAFVLALAFIILMVAFRSVVIPATAILMNLLSVGAAYGLLVLVFQKGIGASIFGFIQVDVIETWLPLMLFSLLFGLSMDYQVFLLSRIRERYLKTGNTSEAVAFGLSSTGKLITGAALIMVAVFGGFALGDMAMFQQMGFGLAVAVLVDATLVRCVLVPATMTMLGKANWYLPRWLNWLPNVSLGETDEAPEAVKVAPAPRLPRGLVPAPVPVTVDETEIIDRKY